MRGIKNAQYYAEFKAGEKVGENISPQKLYPINFELMSKNGKSANFHRFFASY
jgi:hypothetical protein